MLRFIQRSLAVKLGVLVIVAVAAGFSLASMMSMEMLTRSTSRLHREAAGDIAASLAAGVFCARARR
jgi:hypothetical protein